MRIPFERSAEGMEDADETGHKVPAFVHFMEETEDGAADSLKKAVNEFKRHLGHPLSSHSVYSIMLAGKMDCHLWWSVRADMPVQEDNRRGSPNE